MPNPILLLNSFISIALIIIGLSVLLRNTQSILNRLFFLFVLSTALWITSNYFSNDIALSYNKALLANHLALFFPGLVLVFMLHFVTILANNEHINKIAILFYGIYLITLTPLVVKGIIKQDNLYAIKFNTFAPLYFLALLGNAILIFWVLRKAIKASSGVERLKNSTIFWSLSITICINLFTNAVLPYFSGSFVFTNLGPLSAIFIVVGTAYAIVRHRLFDIRFFVVRAAAYLTTLLFATFFYISPIVLLMIFILDVHLNLRIFILLAALSIAMTIFYRFVREFFNRLTNKVFFRDYYEPQEVLDELSSVLVRNVEVKDLQENSKKILTAALKPKYFHYSLVNDEASATGPLLKSLMANTKDNLIIADELLPEENHLISVLQKESVAVAARLRTTHNDLGFILIGYKQSGQAFSNIDKKLLSIATDEIAISLQNALRFKEIQNFNITLQEKIETATHQLRKANQRLKALDEAKDDFISMASHQLRTPLTSVKGYVSMVIEGDAGKISNSQKKLLEQAFVSSQRMVNLIADLLNVSRLNTGKFVIDPAPTNMAEMIKQEIEQLEESAKAHNLELTFDAPEHFPTLMLDETKTRQVIMNFIDNAIYYTPSGGHILIELIDKQSSIELTVTDDGIGVPKDEQHHLFSKFYRAGNARKARPDGTGLGLFMAKKVIVAEGGAIIFASQEGKGSVFGFTFSKAAVQPKAVPKTSK